MKIKLTDQQEQAVKEGRPVEVVDLASERTSVVVAGRGSWTTTRSQSTATISSLRELVRSGAGCGSAFIKYGRGRGWCIPRSSLCSGRARRMHGQRSVCVPPVTGKPSAGGIQHGDANPYATRVDAATISVTGSRSATGHCPAPAACPPGTASDSRFSEAWRRPSGSAAPC